MNQALDLGAEYYIIKPFDISLLLQRIKQIKLYRLHQMERLLL